MASPEMPRQLEPGLGNTYNNKMRKKSYVKCGVSLVRML